jgi:2,4-dienoyl-CoA reductase-like NADH-dependent reductase (Old Yellow Enzyme family)
LPLFVRITATDWVEGGWDIEQSVELAKQLKGLGVDLIDVSSGEVTLSRHLVDLSGPNAAVQRKCMRKPAWPSLLLFRE